MRGLIKAAALLLAPALAGASLFGIDEKVPSAYVTLNIQLGETRTQALTIRLDVEESDHNCGSASIKINGQHLEQDDDGAGSGPLNLDNGAFIDASWVFECIESGGVPLEQLLTFTVTSLDGEDVPATSFSTSFRQTAPVIISDVGGAAYVYYLYMPIDTPHGETNGTTSSSDKDAATGEEDGSDGPEMGSELKGHLQELEDDLDQLEVLRGQAHEIMQAIHVKEMAILEKYGEALNGPPPSDAKPAVPLSECTDLACVANGLACKLKSTADKVCEGITGPKGFFSRFGKGHPKHPLWWAPPPPHHPGFPGGKMHHGPPHHGPPHHGPPPPPPFEGGPPPPPPFGHPPPPPPPGHRLPPPPGHGDHPPPPPPPPGHGPPPPGHGDHPDHPPPPPPPGHDYEEYSGPEGEEPDQHHVAPPPTDNHDDQPVKTQDHGSSRVPPDYKNHDPGPQPGWGPNNQHPPPKEPNWLLISLAFTGTIFGVFSIIGLAYIHRRMLRTTSETRAALFHNSRITREERRARRYVRRSAVKRFLRRFFFRSSSDEEEKEAMLHGRRRGSSVDETTMEQEIAQFREAAFMVEGMVAAEEGRTREMKQHPQHSMPLTRLSVPSMPQHAQSLYPGFIIEERLPSYNEETVDSSIVSNGCRYGPGSSDYIPSSDGSNADDVLGDTKH